MMAPAAQYLTLRSLGAPAVLLSLAMQGVFRGFKDTTTPLYATGRVYHTQLGEFFAYQTAKRFSLCQCWCMTLLFLLIAFFGIYKIELLRIVMQGYVVFLLITYQK